MLISMLISISINIFMLILTSIKLINKINGLISCLVSHYFTELLSSNLKFAHSLVLDSVPAQLFSLL